jgi:hypothetical protein
MREAIIATHAVSKSPDGKSVEFVATLDTDELVFRILVHIWINSNLEFTMTIKEVVLLSPPKIHVILGCDNDENNADLVLAFNFDNETLWINEVGEK